MKVLATSSLSPAAEVEQVRTDGTGRRWDWTDSAARMEGVGRAGKWFLRGEGGAELLGRRGRKVASSPYLGEEVQRLGAGK